MEKLISRRYKERPMPEGYIFPRDVRPGKLTVVPLCNNTIPVIDLGLDGGAAAQACDVVDQILEASQELGFFQVIQILPSVILFVACKLLVLVYIKF